MHPETEVINTFSFPASKQSIAQLAEKLFIASAQVIMQPAQNQITGQVQMQLHSIAMPPEAAFGLAKTFLEAKHDYLVGN